MERYASISIPETRFADCMIQTAEYLDFKNSAYRRRPLRCKTVLPIHSRTSPSYYHGWVDTRVQLDDGTVKMLNHKADARYATTPMFDGP